MPAKSQQQLKLIYAKRNQYGNKSKTPEKWKWVWDEEWTDVKFNKLPEKVQEDYFNRDFIIDFIMNSTKFRKSDLEKKSEKELLELFDKIGYLMQVHPGQQLQLQEGLSNEDREEYINTIMDNSMFERDFLEGKSDDELSELYDEVVDFLEVHPIDPDAHLEEWWLDEEDEGFVTKFDSFINEAKKHKGEKLKFEDWWKKSYEKRADYWVEKKEINQGYQSNELTHYYERKMRSKYNKYLKKRRK